jgi:hypothetical protein
MKNQDFSEAIIVALSILFSLCCFLPVLWKWISNCDESQPNNYKNINLNTFIRVVYTYLTYPMVVGFMVINMLVITIIIDKQLNPLFSFLLPMLSSLLLLTLLFITSFIFFFEAKLLFTLKSPLMYL